MRMPKARDLVHLLVGLGLLLALTACPAGPTMAVTNRPSPRTTAPPRRKTPR